MSESLRGPSLTVRDRRYQPGPNKTKIKLVEKKYVLNGKNIQECWICTTKKIIWCFENPIESEIIGKNAKINIQENYNSLAISDKLDEFLNKIQTL